MLNRINIGEQMMESLIETITDKFLSRRETPSVILLFTYHDRKHDDCSNERDMYLSTYIYTSLFLPVYSNGPTIGALNAESPQRTFPPK